MKYVNWKSASGKTGVDTLESFNEWSKSEGAKGKFKKVNEFESAAPPEGYIPRKSKEQIRKEKADAIKAEEKSGATERKTSAPIGENKTSVSTPPEAKTPPSTVDKPGDML